MPVQASEDPADLGPQDLVVVAVKGEGNPLVVLLLQMVEGAIWLCAGL